MGLDSPGTEPKKEFREMVIARLHTEIHMSPNIKICFSD